MPTPDPTLEQQIQFARHNFENHQALIRFADTKAAAIITIVIFPLTFVSSVYVPTDSMPPVLEAIANVNPITSVVDALRALWLGAPAHSDIATSLAWCVGIVAVFSVLATARYRRTVAR